ncbi:PhoH [Pseudanabaena phage Pam2]|nr:PhoH [Pseudanabaena phage Pam2]
MAKQRNQSTALFDISKLLKVEAKTENQQRAFDYFSEGYNLILSGSAGSGKTMLALYLGLKSLLLRKYEKVVIVRSIVPTRNIGFLKGTQQEKECVYEQTYLNLVNKLLPTIPNAYDVMKKEKTIEFTSTSFIRGNNIDKAVVIIDEFSNLTYHELSSVITRLGENVRVIFSGDFYQSDLRYSDEKEGVLKFLKVLSLMEEDFKRVDFTIDDVVRSGLVKRFLLAEHELRQ